MKTIFSKALKQRIKNFLKSLRKDQRISKLESTAAHVTRQQLANDLRALGLAAGDIVFVHSSLKSLGYVEGGAAAVIEALQDVVGLTGTLLLPTYYLPGVTILDTCKMKGYVFDPRRHGSTMGALPAAFLAIPGVCRSIHPTHSVSAVGKHARYLTEAHHLAPSVFGVGSPWQRFCTLPQCKVLGLGVSMGPITFYHMVEDIMGDEFPVAVWQQPIYQMPCLDDEGKSCTVPVRAFNTAVTLRRIDSKDRGDLRDYFSAEFKHVHLKRDGRVGSTVSWVIDGPAFLSHMIALAREGITIYSTPEELAERPIPGWPVTPSVVAAP